MLKFPWELTVNIYVRKEREREKKNLEANMKNKKKMRKVIKINKWENKRVSESTPTEKKQTKNKE